MEERHVVWSGSPSQITNWNVYLLTVVTFGFALFFIILPPELFASFHRFVSLFLFLILLIAPLTSFFCWMSTAYTEYILTAEELHVRSGILGKSSDRLELYRVRDYAGDQPFILRLLSGGKRSNIRLETSDRSHPNVWMSGISDGENVLEILRTQVEKCRIEKRIREVNIE